VFAQVTVPGHVFGRRRLFEPGQVERGEGSGAAHDLGSVEALVGVGHQLKTGAEPPSRTAASRAASSLTCGRPILILAPLKPCAWAAACATEFVSAQVKPAALGGVDRHPALGTTQQLPQRQLLAARAPVPQRRVHTGQRQAGDGTDGGGMRVEEQVFADRLDVQGVTPSNRGARWSCSSAITEEPPVPMV